MIEGGGLGVVAPEDIGPLDVQVANGVVDVAVADEAEAVAVARQFLVVLRAATGRVVVRRPDAPAFARARTADPDLRHPPGRSTGSPTTTRCSSCDAASAPG